MATNGAYGFRKNGVDKLDYQHGDGWVRNGHFGGGLGEHVIKFIKLVDTERMIQCFDDIVVVDKLLHYDKTGDLALYVLGEETQMVNGHKFYTDFDYVLDLDKEVLHYRHHDIKLEIGFEFIRSQKIDDIVDFIKYSEIEIEFDRKLENGFEDEILELMKTNNFFYLGENRWGTDLHLDKDKLSDEELKGFAEDFAEEHEIENLQCWFCVFDEFEGVEGFYKKIKQMISNLEKKSGIKIIVSSYYSHPI